MRKTRLKILAMIEGVCGSQREEAEAVSHERCGNLFAERRISETTALPR